MSGIVITLLSGSGTAPKAVGLNSEVRFDASDLGASSYRWEVTSKPRNSDAIISSILGAATNLINIDTIGVYQLRLVTNKDTSLERTYTSSVSVPGSISPKPLPPEPLYDTGGRVLNFSFELPGALDGWANNWALVDESSILDGQAGILRGRIIPTNFDVNSGRYVMCLGDDIGSEHNFTTGDIFSISQNVDLRSINKLTVQLKFNKG